MYIGDLKELIELCRENDIDIIIDSYGIILTYRERNYHRSFDISYVEQNDSYTVEEFIDEFRLDAMMSIGEI